MGQVFGKIWYKNGSTFQVSVARFYPNHINELRIIYPILAGPILLNQLIDRLGLHVRMSAKDLELG